MNRDPVPTVLAVVGVIITILAAFISLINGLTSDQKFWIILTSIIVSAILVIASLALGRSRS